MITNQQEYEEVMLRLANIPLTSVGTPEEDIVNGLIEDLRQYEFHHHMFNPEDEIAFGSECNG